MYYINWRKPKTSDLEAKEKLLMVKDKLLNKVSEVSEDLIEIFQKNNWWQLS
jgi:nicotinamide mononucleotide (NMN) deamidase PncC